MIIFLNPLKELDPFSFSDKTRIKIVIDTRILLVDFSIDKESFFIIPNMKDVEELGNGWDKVIKEEVIPNLELYKKYKKFRGDQYKDTVIKACNIIKFLYRGAYKTKDNKIVSKPIQPVNKNFFEDKILSDDRIDKYLKKARNYNPTNRSNTTSTRQEIKDTVSLICFKTLFNLKYIKQMPKLSNDGKYHIRINPFKLEEGKANKLKNLPKIAIN
jgi:hypothetical protein